MTGKKKKQERKKQEKNKNKKQTKDKTNWIGFDCRLLTDG